jgi:hypothetical protein
MTNTLSQPNQISAIAGQVQAGHLQGFLIFASSRYCPWCGLVVSEQLLPRLRARDFPPIAIVEFDINDSQPLATRLENTMGGLGPPMRRKLSPDLSPSTWAKSHQIRVVPTVTAVDQQLSPLLPPLVGYGSADFYGAYLEEQVRESIRYWARNR